MRGILVQPFGFVRNASAAWMSRQRSTTMGGLIGARCTPATGAAHPEKGALLFFSRCNPRFLPRRAECHRTFLDAKIFNICVALFAVCLAFMFEKPWKLSAPQLPWLGVGLSARKLQIDNQ